MPSEETKILEFNQYRTSDKIPFIIYADLECFIEKINGYKNHPLHQKYTNIFYQVFQCSQYCHLKAENISMIYIEVMIT